MITLLILVCIGCLISHIAEDKIEEFIDSISTRSK